MKRAFLLPILLTVCLSAVAQKKLRVSPQWLPQAQFAGLYVAQEKGFYKEVGVDVEIIHPSATRGSALMLKEGDTDIITLQLVDALIHWEQGFKLVNVLQMSENTAQVIVSHKPLASPEDLNDKRVGYWKGNVSNLGFILCNQRNLSVEWVPFHSNIALFISGAIDATMAMEYGEYFQLQMAGRKLDKDNVLAMRDYGLNIQEDGVYVKPEFLKKYPAEVKKFAAATRRGWEWARKKENRKEAIDIVMKQLAKDKVHSNRVNQEYMLNTVLRLQENKSGVAPYALTKERYEETLYLMLKQKHISKAIPYEEFYYDTDIQ